MTQTQLQLEENHLADYLAVIRKRWRTVLATFLGFVAVAGIVSLRLPPVYQATARIVIGSSFGKGLLSEGVTPVEGYFLERRSFETQLEIIQSEPVAKLAVVILGWVDEDASDERKEQVASQIKARVSVQHLRDTRIVLLRAVDSSPERAQEIANAVAAAYIDYTRAEGDEARTRSIAWLTSEIESLRGQLRNSEERLVDYLATEKIDLAGAASTTARDSTASDDVLRANLAAAELELSELLGRYRGRHPKVLETRARVDSLRHRLMNAQGSQAEDHRKLIQYRLLKRDADLDREMYEVLLKKLKEADVREGLSDVNIRILEHAKRPSVPIEPRTPRNLAIAALLGLCLAIALAYGVEYFDRSVGTADEAMRVLGLPTLAVVSSFGRRTASVGLPAEVPASKEGEMFRTLRTNLRFSHVDMPRRVVLVTSTGPEEGKTTVVANLGVSLAQSGRRTLLVDTDFRRPALHGMLDLPESRGLADVLAGDAELTDAIRRTRVDGLEVLACGTLPANPAELIESARLQEMIARLRSSYEYVLLDSPPAGGLVDASLLSSIADGVLFVIEPRRFDWRVLRGAVRQLGRAGARIYGVVINKAPEEAASPLYGYYGKTLGSVRGPRRGHLAGWSGVMVAAPRWLPPALLGLLATAIALRGGVAPGAAALLCLLTGAIGLVAASGRRLPPLSPAAGGLALLWSGVALASILWSRHVDASLDGSAAVICASLVWMLGATLVDEKARRRFVIGFTIGGAVVASLALAKATPGQPASIPLGNPNHLAAWLLLPGSLALVALLFSEPTRRGSRESAFLWFGLVAIIGAGIAATASRGAGLVAGLALGALLILYLLGPRRGILAAASAVLGAALILLFAPPLAPDLLPVKVGGGESSAGMRWAVYAAAASAALDVVPLGAGLGAFASAFEAYRPPTVPYAVNFAHSEPLQGLIELGLPFLLVFAITVFVAVRSARRILSRPWGPRFTWGAVTATLGLSAHSLIDFPLHVPAIALSGATLAGLAFAGTGEDRRPGGIGSAAATRLILAGLSIALLGLAGSQAVAVLFAERADQRLAVGDFQGSLRAAEHGLRARPGRTALLSRAASAAEHQYRFRGGDPRMLRRALEARSRAVNANRGNAVLRIERARTRALAGDTGGAQRDLEVVTGQDASAPIALLARARLDLHRGDSAAAVAALRSALELYPHAAAETATAVLHGSGDPGFLRASMPRDAGGHRTAAGVLARAGFLRHAAEEYEGAFALNPEDMESALSAGSNFARVGDLAAARAVLERARRESPEDARIERALARAAR